MSPYALYAADLVAILILTFAVYLPRHRRRDLVVAFLAVNVGVLAVSAALAQSTIAAGLGLGLFGVLSIIRLRSTELAQHEVAYYFAALALGLIGGLGTTSLGLGIGLMAALVVVIAAADSPRLLHRLRQQVVVVDRAIADETALVAHLERLLGGRVHAVTVQRLDLVNDTTTVDVRFSAGAPPLVAPTTTATYAEPGTVR
ncbi:MULTISPECIES: DUF4956 domain-containing protein [Cellulomonas]|uniref:Permease n=1 Tax=Cellulomonas gilvus (strain ATCC 13127 / NRRL B-14078) TaxID=593907 RepID=F8A3B1_CELGA|nr:MULTISPECIES: DUF4956 domain-containing protein [Cellulomonas]AEI13104.1 hypothetical protein Celgi_2605 [Cellulomonas gilvus ATCC 13127]MCR6689138.1 DUF4956 domain-containing protein [Cellulomonas sp.]